MDPDAAIENLRQAIRVWREAVVSGSADAEHETAAEVISTVENLDDWLSRGGHPPGAWAPRAPAPPDADAAYATYAEAASRFARAVEYQAAKRVRSDFPAATSIHLASEYSEDLVLHVRLVAVNGPTGLLADNRNGSEVWDELTGEIEPYLSWRGQRHRHHSRRPATGRRGPGPPEREHDRGDRRWPGPGVRGDDRGHRHRRPAAARRPAHRGPGGHRPGAARTGRAAGGRTHPAHRRAGENPRLRHIPVSGRHVLRGRPERLPAPLQPAGVLPGHPRQLQHPRQLPHGTQRRRRRRIRRRHLSRCRSVRRPLHRRGQRRLPRRGR